MKYPETKEKLNELVINLLHMHMIVRRHHWYMRGSQFLKFHPYLDDLMDELDDQIDGLAERLITIDGSPVATLREVVQLNKIPGEKGSWDFTNTQRLEKIISGYRYLDKLYEEALEASDKDGGVEIRISNHGHLPQPLPQFFEPWARGDASRTSGGSGLGLPIVYQIMELHEGNVRIEENDGNVTVTLYFPGKKES